jgi:hypothetical protein
MSGFSPSWLSLREPADQAARNREVLGACMRHFAPRTHVAVCDLGAGTGASVRAFAEYLPAQQTWTLVDHDARNLAVACDSLRGWADEAEPNDNALILKKGGKDIAVRTRVADLSEKADWSRGTDLVTASALFDLISERWISRFAAALVADKLPLLATLTADGRMHATPGHAHDDAVWAKFREHQTRDKGFGPSAGAAAARFLEDVFARAGYVITAGDSPWILEQGPLLRATAEGIAQAVAETGDLEAPALTDWLAQATTPGRRLIIGHRDLFAAPP